VGSSESHFRQMSRQQEEYFRLQRPASDLLTKFGLGMGIQKPGSL
jgi:hypothetical protein